MTMSLDSMGSVVSFAVGRVFISCCAGSNLELKEWTFKHI